MGAIVAPRTSQTRDNAWVLLLVLVSALSLAGCNRQPKPEPIHIQVTASRYTFQPPVIHIKKGQDVILEISTSDVQHGFEVKELGIDKPISELRKDLRRSVGDSLNSRVSELQLDVETGIGDVFNARVKEINTQISKNVSDVLNHQVTDLQKEVEQGVTQVIDTRAAEIRQHIEQGMT